MKYLDINLAKDEQDLNTESCKPLLREIKNLNKERGKLISCVGRLNVDKKPILSKLV